VMWDWVTEVGKRHAKAWTPNLQLHLMREIFSDKLATIFIGAKSIMTHKNPFLQIEPCDGGDIYTSRAVMDNLVVLCDEFSGRASRDARGT